MWTKALTHPFKVQLLGLIEGQPGISTVELAAQLNQTKKRTGTCLTRLRQSGFLTAIIPKISNQSYGWTLAGHEAPSVEPEPEPIAATAEPVITPKPEIAPEPEPEPVITPEPVAEDIDDEEEAGFSITTPHSAQLSKGLTEEDMQWHRYWHSRAAQRASDSARRVKSLIRTDWMYPTPCDCSHPNPPPCDEPAIYRVENLK
jgi:hypothetical protein